MRGILKGGGLFVIVLVVAAVVVAIVGITGLRMPWQEDPARAAARERLEDCLYQLMPCSQAQIDRLRYEALEK